MKPRARDGVILLMAIPWGLTLLQGEMGSVLVMIFVFGVMMFFGGIRIRTLVGSSREQLKIQS